MKLFWVSLGNFLLGGVLVWLLVVGELRECRTQIVADQHMIETLTDEHRAMADKLVHTKRQLDSAYTDLAHELGKKVDITIPFKPVKAEQVSQVQVESNEIAGLAKMVSKFETAFKLATRGK